MIIEENQFSQMRFDYGMLDADVATDAKTAAEHIRETLIRTTAGIIQIGERLKMIKTRLPHGKFMAWLAAEFGMSDRISRKYMSAAEFAAGKTEIVSALQPSTVYALAAPSTPDAIKTSVIERLEKGQVVSDREIKQLIAKAKHPETNSVGEPAAPLANAGDGQADDIKVLAEEHVITDAKPPIADTETDNDPLTVAIHAVKNLPPDDLADFDGWYRKTYPPSEGAVLGSNVALNDPNQLTIDFDAAPVEPDVVPGGNEGRLPATLEPVPEPAASIEDDPIVAMLREFKPNPQKCGRDWVINGSPEVVPWAEHHVVADRLKPWRESFRAASPERQTAIRRWLEQQQS